MSMSAQKKKVSFEVKAAVDKVVEEETLMFYRKNNFSDAYKDCESEYDPFRPKLITCPHCKKEVLPDVKMKWDREYMNLEPQDTCTIKWFSECCCHCDSMRQAFDRHPSETDRERSRAGAQRVYVHICPKCKQRIRYGFDEEEAEVFD